MEVGGAVRALRGMIGSVFLALARALGETMAVTMVIGNVPADQSNAAAPGYTIAAVIANEFTGSDRRTVIGSLIELALVLFAVTMIINALARLLMLGMKSRRPIERLAKVKAEVLSSDV